MKMSLVITYIIVFAVLYCLELLYFRIADKYNIIDKPNERSSHDRITLRGGGVIFYLAVCIYFLCKFQYPFFVAGLTCVSVISFYDDIKPLRQSTRLLFHFIGMFFLFYEWALFTLGWWWTPIALFCCIGIINAYNFMDGINGITGGYSFIVLLVLGYVNHFMITFVDEQFIVTVLLGIIVFNIFNFRKKAKCFAGDVGSVSIAFIILFLLGKLIIQTHDLSWIVLLVVYGVDSVLTIIHRIMLHERIGEPHRKHVYQLLANELKIPHTYVSLSYMVLQLAICIVYIAFPELHWIIFISSILFLSIGYILFIRKYFVLHQT